MHLSETLSLPEAEFMLSISAPLLPLKSRQSREAYQEPTSELTGSYVKMEMDQRKTEEAVSNEEKTNCT